MNEEEEE